MADTIHAFEATRLGGESESLSAYKGKVVLVVNTASKCGFTPQYEGLQSLYQELGDRGFVVLGFPCNQFGQQEPGEAGEISEFCGLNYGVDFPMFDKVDVNGSDAHPLFQHLKSAAPGVLGTTAIKWNFTKFLVDPDGVVVKRYGSTTTPEQIKGDILGLLDA